MTGFFKRLLGEDDRKTFEQDLELLVARWMSRDKREFKMSGAEIAQRLRSKATQIEREP